ncbi:hypothetical protein EDD85DRAFT_81154 [Armillaria nabsnona]|nr:hypothetical protein EDD85DRAFT_81154 [Armillaria nabsnona]
MLVFCISLFRPATIVQGSSTSHFFSPPNESLPTRRTFAQTTGSRGMWAMAILATIDDWVQVNQSKAEMVCRHSESGASMSWREGIARRTHPIHNDRAPSCVENARSYPYDSLLRVNYQVLAANGTSRVELLKGGLHAGMRTLKGHIKPFRTNTGRRLGTPCKDCELGPKGGVVCNIPSAIFGDQRQTHAE